MVKHSPEKRGTSNLMTDGEFEDFWLCLDAHRQFYATHGYPHQPARLLSSHYQAVQQSVRHAEADGADAFARGRYKSSQRCGTCRGCTSSDCGQCKNCKDKPRYVAFPLCRLPHCPLRHELLRGCACTCAPDGAQ